MPLYETIRARMNSSIPSVASVKQLARRLMKSRHFLNVRGAAPIDGRMAAGKINDGKSVFPLAAL
jgi:hypothetical protein